MSRVALTFDDGPARWTEPILDTLGEHGVRATFFVIGSVAREGRHLLERMVDEGHHLGNHSWSHPWLARDCDDARVEEELERTNRELEELVGLRPRLYRAPRYDVDERVDAVARSLGLTHTHGDVRPADWGGRLRGSVIATLVLRHVAPDTIVGLHDGVPPGSKGGEGQQSTAEAVAITVPRLLERGFTFVTASELVRSDELRAAEGVRDDIRA